MSFIKSHIELVKAATSFIEGNKEEALDHVVDSAEEFRDSFWGKLWFKNNED